MKQPIYLVIGVPGSGKSWVCEQLTDKFNYVRHDDYQKAHPEYLEAIIDASSGDKPVLAEAPFSISQTVDPLEASGIKVIPVFIIENDAILSTRYFVREKRVMPTGHFTRQVTYLKRAKDWGSFVGTSDEVLSHLKEKA